MKGLSLQVLITHSVENEIIMQRIIDGYINATAMCKAAGKLMGDYVRLESTNAFLSELSRSMGIPIDGKNSLVQVIRTGLNEHRGTWVHPQIATHLAQWLSPQFAVLVSKWLLDWMSGKQRYTMPYHLRRHIANEPNVPHGHFSMLCEVLVCLVGPLEAQGYVWKENMIPDISLGRMFSKLLREKGFRVDDFPAYPHSYEDGRIVQARAYPNEHLAEMRRFFKEDWVQNHARKYFSERDQAALPHLEKVLSLPFFGGRDKHIRGAI